MPYEDRLNQLSLITLEGRKRFLNRCYPFKIVNRLTYFPNSPLHLITTSYESSHSQTLYIPTAKRTCFKTPSFVRYSYRLIATQTQVPECLFSGGGPILVAYLNVTDLSQQCPSSWREYTPQMQSASHSSALFPATGHQYSRGFGQIIQFGYQVGITHVFNFPRNN